MNMIRLLVSIGLLIIMIVVAVAPAAAQDVPECERSVVIVAGDSLSGLAGRYLGSSAAYDRIVAATNARAAVDDSYATIVNPALISVGWRVCIPAAAVVIPSSVPAVDPTSTPPTRS